MNSIFISLLTLAAIFSEEFTQKRQFESDKISVELNEEHGKLNGKYVSRYKNGQKKAEGAFVDNCRMGNWKVWDDKGNILVERNYSDPFLFEYRYPSPTREATIENLSRNSHVLSRNEEGVYEYSDINQKSIDWSKRVWRRVELAKNPKLNEKNKLIKCVYGALKKGELELYDPKDDELGTTLEANPEFLNAIQKQYKIIALEIKEDAFFDSRREISETRIIGMAFIGKNIQSGKEKKLFWLYYPQLRKQFAQVPVKTQSLFEIEHLEDVFFYRDFSSTVIRESSSMGNYFSDILSPKEVNKEALRVEIDILEAEHDWWVKLASN